MNYLSAKETAQKWGVNVSLVKRYCTLLTFEPKVRLPKQTLPQPSANPMHRQFEAAKWKIR